MAIADSIRPVRNLYALSLSESGIDSQFILLAQAAEVLSRRQYNIAYMDNDEYMNKLYPSLKKAVKNNIADHCCPTNFMRKLSVLEDYTA